MFLDNRQEKSGYVADGKGGHGRRSRLNLDAGNDAIDRFVAEALVELLVAHESAEIERTDEHVDQRLRVDVLAELAGRLGPLDHLGGEGPALVLVALAAYRLPGRAVGLAILEIAAYQTKSKATFAP